MTQEEKLAAINQKAAAINDLKRRLKETDYKVTKALEWGNAVDPDVKNERQGWRDDINDLEQEIAELQDEEPDETEV